MKLRHIALLAIAAPAAFSQSYIELHPNLQGTVHDSLGAAVPNSTVELIRDSKEGSVVVATVHSDSQGHYALAVSASGTYRVRASAGTFQSSTTAPHFVALKSLTALDLTLGTPTFSEQVTVTATGTPTTLAQTGAPITILTADQFPHSPELQQPLRLVPGLQLTQTGQTGGVTELHIRGGDSDANKILLDGAPLNDIGGAVNFANLASVGIQQIEVLREPNSALYGSDALAGVIQFTSSRGATPLPLLSYAVDGGNFGFFRQEADLSGTHRRFDFFNSFARLNTSNSIASNAFHDATFAGNYGFAPDTRTDLRLTLRHLATDGGQPNAILLYGIPDAADQTEHDLYLSALANQQSTPRWHNELQYGRERLRSQYTDFLATGIPGMDAFGDAIFLGKPVTITGANGYTASGQAIFQYSNSLSTFNTSTNRDFVYAQSDFKLTPHLTALGAFRYEDERGFTVSTGGSYFSAVDHGNYSYTTQFAGDIKSRLFLTLGSGLEQNAVYGFAGTPRASLAFYLIRPAGQSFFSGTKLHGSFGKGVKGPNIGQETSSVYDQLTPAQRAQFNIHPLNAAYSRTFDAGIEQQFGDGRARLNLTFFHNQFTNGVEYVSQSGLVELGVPSTAANDTEFGAYTNSLAFRALGGESEFELRLTRSLFARAGYTYLDARVQHSFSSDALGPSFNTVSTFSTLPIGEYGPLIGARPFRRAPHTGYFALDYTHAQLSAHLSGTLVGRRDDSTFLSDPGYTGALLLPNRNLDGSYQRLELTADYRISSHITVYSNLQNLLNERYNEAFGYPALPFNLRGGVKFSFGGESFRIR